jgi:hypothetical protein
VDFELSQRTIMYLIYQNNPALLCEYIKINCFEQISYVSPVFWYRNSVNIFNESKDGLLLNLINHR